MKTLELKKLDIKVLDEKSLINTNGGIIYPVLAWGFILSVGALYAFSGLAVAALPVINDIREKK